MNQYREWWPREVSGVGEKTATKVAEGFEAFWAAHPEFCRPETEEAAA